jgi:hypothetical protein
VIYEGYLERWKPLIAAMILAGQSNREIARLLCRLGVRSYTTSPGFPTLDEEDSIPNVSAMVGYFRRKWEAPPKRTHQRRTIRASWTPEMVWQETEGLDIEKS